MSTISTHVLDTARGRPAAGLVIVIERATGADGYQELGRGTTNDDGRVRELVPGGTLEPGTYRITFETGDYLAKSGGTPFYPRARIEFTITPPDEHYHIPLLLSPYGYSTYRGS